jgi:mRNA interferase YafQ
MKALFVSGRFQKDYKLALRRGKNMQKLQTILEHLAASQPLPARCRPHKLSGNYADLWECHIEPDWLLIYGISDTQISLYRTGTHSDLFE